MNNHLRERNFNSLFNKAFVYLITDIAGDTPAVPDIIGIAAELKIQAVAAEILKQHIRRRIFQDIFILGGNIKQDFGHFFDIRTISHAYRNRLARPVIGMREVGNRAGQQSCIRNNNARFFECFNFGRADINLFNLPFFSRNDYPVADFNRTLEQDNDAGNKVIDNILQTETDKNFYLPMMSENGFGLKIIENKEQWLLSVINSSREVPMKLLYLVAQSEDSIFFQKVWNPKDSYLVFDKKHFPKGISSFALVDSMKNLLCGRVVLNIQEQTDFQSLPPDFRMGLLPLKNQIDSDPSRLSLAWDLIAMTLEVTPIKNLSQPNPDIWKTVNLDEVSIIASMRRKQKYNGLYSGSLPSSRVIYRQNIEQWHIQDMRSLLYLLESVNISWYVVDHVYKECVFIQDYGAISFQTDPVKNYEPPLFVVDDVPYQNYDILSFPVTEIEEIFILKGVDAAIYGPKGKRGIIVVTTKRNKPPYEK